LSSDCSNLENKKKNSNSKLQKQIPIAIPIPSHFIPKITIELHKTVCNSTSISIASNNKTLKPNQTKGTAPALKDSRKPIEHQKISKQ
jgi:hypothetical protein